MVLGLSHPLNANIKGIVLDSLSLEPVADAVIISEEFPINTITDSEGRFELQIEDFEHIHLISQHPDYHQTITVIDENGNNETVILMRKTGSLTKQITVTADKYSYRRGTVLNHAELDKQKGISLAETITNMQGISMRTMGSATARPVFRGLGSYRISINNDGMSVNDLSASSPDHAVTANAGSAEKIEVLTGPDMLEYSTALSGGVVNIISQLSAQEMPESYIQEIRLDYESASQAKIFNSNAIIPVNNFAFFGSANYTDTEDINSAQGVLNNTYSNFYDLKGAAAYYGNNFKIIAEGSLYNSEYGIPGGFVGAHPNGVDIKMHQNNSLIAAEYNLKGKIDKTELKFKNSYYNHQEFESSGKLGSEFVVRENSAKINIKHNNLLGTDAGNAGLDFSHKANLFGGYVFTAPADEIGIAPYWIIMKSIDNLDLKFGARYEHRIIKPDSKYKSGDDLSEKKTFDMLSASITANYNFTDKINAGFVFSRSERSPSVEELFKEGPHLAAYSFEKGNPDLEKEQSINYEIFANYNHERSKGSITGYIYDFSKYITPRNTGDTNWATLLPIYATSEVPAIIAGFDLGFEQLIYKNLWFKFNAGYVYGEISETESPIPMIPPFKGETAIEYRANSFSAGINSDYAFSQNRVDTFEEPTAGYIVFGIDASYNFLWGGNYNSIFMSIDNIFDKEYRNHLSRIKSVFPESGINIKLGYKLII